MDDLIDEFIAILREQGENRLADRLQAIAAERGDGRASRVSGFMQHDLGGFLDWPIYGESGAIDAARTGRRDRVAGELRVAAASAAGA